MRLNYGKKVNVFVWLKDKCHKHVENKKLFLEGSWIKSEVMRTTDALAVDTKV